VKTGEFRRWLKAHGVEFKEGSKHTKLSYKGRQSILPRHAAELPEGTPKAIIKQLGL